MSDLPKEYKQTEVGVIPNDWDVRSIDSICEFVLDCDHSTPIWTESGVIVIRNQNIRSGKLDLKNPSYTDEIHYKKRTRRATPKFGDIIITREAPMGLACMVPEKLKCCLGQRMVLMRPVDNEVNNYYFLYSVLGELIQKQILIGGGAGSTVSNLRIPTLKKINVPFPPPPEQQAIASALADVDALLDSLEELLTKKRQLKQAAMQELLTGKTRLDGFEGEWEEKRLGEVCEMRSGEAITSTSISENGLYPCYGGNGLRGYTSKYTHNGRFVIIGRVGALCGNIKFATGKFFASEHAIVVSPEINADVIWLGAILSTLNLNSMSESSAQPVLTVGKVSKLTVSLPALPEQKAIAAILSEMDTELEALEDRLSKTRELKQGMMQELLTGRTRLL